MASARLAANECSCVPIIPMRGIKRVLGNVVVCAIRDVWQSAGNCHISNRASILIAAVMD